jgi:hypothetical protein
LGTIQNGMNERYVSFNADAIIMVATTSVDKRMKYYNHLAEKYAGKFGTVYKDIKTNTGVATIVISHRVPKEVQESLYKFAIARSDNK